MSYLIDSSNIFTYDFDYNISTLDMSNKLFCTFSLEEDLDGIVSVVKSRYEILYNKIFILQCLDQNEFVVTYNIDFNNVGDFLENTILVHRKKHTNTLYTINALNELIMELNNGYLDKNFMVNWKDYKNSILLTKNGNLEVIKTKLYKIVEV